MTQNGEPGNMSSNSQFASSGALPLSPVAGSPPMRGPGRARGDSGSYYEDVDPRFAVEESPPPPALTPGGMPPGAISRDIPGGFPEIPGVHPQGQAYGQRMQSPHPTSPPPPPHSSSHPPAPQAPPTEYLHPSYLSAGGPSAGAVTGAGANDPSPSSDHPHLSAPSMSYNGTPNGSSQEDLPEGARSPGQGSERASEASHFTSISQRPVNPNWRPGPLGSMMGSGPGGAGMSSASAAQRRREDVLLSGNPDFSLPPGVARGGRGGGGVRGAMRGGRGAPRGSVPPAVGLTPGGRYPTDI